MAPATLRRARRVARFVILAAKHMPFPCLCLPQALVAQLMLSYRRIPTTLYLGVAKKESQALMAHAWLRAGSDILTGRPGYEAFVVVATFAKK